MRRRDVTADVHLIIEVTEPPLRHRDRHPREVADAASSLLHAGANPEDIDQAGKSEKSKHLRLRCGQQQLTPGDSGRYASGVADPTGGPASCGRSRSRRLRRNAPKLLLVQTPSLHPARRRILVPVVVSHRSPGKAPGCDRRVACDGIAPAADPVENNCGCASVWGDLPE